MIGLQWDGIFDTVNGQRTFQREISPFFSYAPSVLMIGRFNYAIGWYANPGEGVSLDTATMIEPTQEYGFNLFDLVRQNLASVRGYVQSTPIYQGVSNVNGQYYTRWSNWPTQYQISSGIPNNSSPWQLVSSPNILVPAPSNNTPLFVRTRNSFGTSNTNGASVWIQYYPAASQAIPGTSYVIANAYSGKVLDVVGGSTDNTALIQQYDSNGAPWQQ